MLDNWQIPVGDWVEQTVFWVDNNLQATIGVIKWPFDTLINIIVNEWLLQMSWLTVCIAVFLIGWLIRNFQVGFMAFIGLLVCGLLGEAFWRETALTIGFIGVAVLVCVIVGIPIGVLCGRVDGAWKVVRPILDAMQVVHSFVYMLPFVFFFKIGFVAATMVTMTFALPPLIRLTNLGIRQVPEDVVEASRAYGAPEWRVLTDVQLPLARPAIMTGLNQTLLLAISMLGIAAIMGAGGLGSLLFRAINNLDIALGWVCGLGLLPGGCCAGSTQPARGRRFGQSPQPDYPGLEAPADPRGAARRYPRLPRRLPEMPNLPYPTRHSRLWAPGNVALSSPQPSVRSSRSSRCCCPGTRMPVSSPPTHAAPIPIFALWTVPGSGVGGAVPQPARRGRHGAAFVSATSVSFLRTSMASRLPAARGSGSSSG